MDGKRRWGYVATGLRLKMVALWLLIASPTALFVADVLRWPLIETTAIAVAVAVAVDVAGRCLCLAAPVPNRFPLVASVTLQTTAVVGAAVALVVAGAPGLVLALGVGVFLQWCAASLFTKFLSDLAGILGRPDIQTRTARLHWSILTTAMTTGATSAGLLVIAVVLAFLIGTLVLFCMPCWPVAAQIDPGALLPVFLVLLALIVLPAVTYMWFSYGVVVTEIRRTVESRVRYSGRTPEAHVRVKSIDRRTPEGAEQPDDPTPPATDTCGPSP